jgi:spore germination cell wall hydrolase CwlJ-like protein
MTAVDKIDQFINRNEDMIYRIGILFTFIFLGIVIPGHHLIESRARLLESQLMYNQYVSDTNIEMHNLSDKIADLSVRYQKSETFKREASCLAENIYYEVGTESKEGMLAIAQVTINRQKAGFANSICGVVHQKSDNGCQFSWVCEIKNPVPADAFKKAYEIAQKVLTNGFALSKLNGALYYHADYVNPKWNEATFITQIGHHKFYGKESNANKR